jgi:hypothetical protein
MGVNSFILKIELQIDIRQLCPDLSEYYSEERFSTLPSETRQKK